MGLASLTFELRDLLGSVQHRVVLTLSESEYRRALTLPSSPLDNQYERRNVPLGTQGE